MNKKSVLLFYKMQRVYGIVRILKSSFILQPPIALRCRSIDYISTESDRSITAFQVEMNSTFLRHRSAVTSHEYAVRLLRQRNAIAVWYERTFMRII